MAEATRWIDQQQLRKGDVVGQRVDLRALFEKHESAGRWRVMLYQAADRLLRKRGATTNLDEIDVKGPFLRDG